MKSLGVFQKFLKRISHTDFTLVSFFWTRPIKLNIQNVFSASATVTVTTSSSSRPPSPLSPETNNPGSLLLRSDKHHKLLHNIIASCSVTLSTSEPRTARTVTGRESTNQWNAKTSKGFLSMQKYK